MNKLIQNLLLLLLPFYPFWAWLCFTLTNKPINIIVSVILIPIALYLVVYVNRRLPKYLILLIVFTLYHLGSVFINETIPAGSNKIFFLLADPNIMACLFFVIIENSVFNNEFIKTMNKLVLLIVVLSFIVSLIQIKLPNFFFNAALDPELGYTEGNRCSSIYSWTNLNSLGISFPIMISILVSVYEKKKYTLPFIILSGIVVSFLSKARYVMISGIVVLTQLFFNTKTSAIKKASFVVIFLAGIYFINIAAQNFGYDINEVINNRILEKENDMGSAKARIQSYEVFLIAFPQHPWFGVGPETKKDVVDLLDGVPLIHVGYLSYLYFYGVIGCLILFFAIFFLLRDAWKVGKRDNFWGIFYGLISFCLANLTLVYFNFSEMGIVISLIYLRHFNYNSSLAQLKDIIINHQLQDSEINQNALMPKTIIIYNINSNLKSYI